MFLFTMFDEEKLISIVKNYKCLYDKSDKFYHDTIVRDNQWKEIAKLMNEQEDVCKRKWKYLREAFRKAMRLREGRNSEAAGQKPWKYEKQMEFLKTFISERSQTSNSSNVPGNDSIAEYVKSEYSEETPVLPSGKFTFVPTAAYDGENFETTSASGSSMASDATTPSTKKRKKEEHAVAHVLEQYLASKKEQTQHPLDRFFLSLADDVKTLPLHLQLRVKREVLESVSKAQLEAASLGQFDEYVQPTDQ